MGTREEYKNFTCLSTGLPVYLICPMEQTVSPAEKIAKAKSDYKGSTRVERPPRPDIDCRVAEYRDALNLSLEDVGKAVGLTKQAILHIERGNSLAIRSMFALAKFFGVAVVDLWPDLGKKQ